MIELSTHIEYMLLTHDEVSVPQLGTFIVKDMSSRRVDEEGIFLPPYRTVTFQWDERKPARTSPNCTICRAMMRV